VVSSHIQEEMCKSENELEEDTGLNVIGLTCSEATNLRDDGLKAKVRMMLFVFMLMIQARSRERLRAATCLQEVLVC